MKLQRLKRLTRLPCSVIAAASISPPPPPSCVVTSHDLSSALSPCPDDMTWLPLRSPARLNTPPSAWPIIIDDAITFQTITGIGSSLEASSCFNIARLAPASRAHLMTRLFDANEGIGLSLMRVTIGTSDFTPPPYYSYDDSPQPDPSLSNFSLAADRGFVLPCITAALQAQPQVTQLTPCLINTPIP